MGKVVIEAGLPKLIKSVQSIEFCLFGQLNPPVVYPELVEGLPNL